MNDFKGCLTCERTECECYEHSNNETIKTKFCVSLKDVRKNGLNLDSPLLWALLPDWVMFISINFWRNLTLHKNEPDLDKWGFLDKVREGNAFKGCISMPRPEYIKINYTGDWKDSLTKRPED